MSNIVYKIIVPTILFSVINYFPKIILRGAGVDFWSFLRDTLLGGSLWFTCALAVSEILIGCILISRNNTIWFYLFSSVLLALMGVLLAKLDIQLLGDKNIPWYYKSGMVASLYLSFGGLYWKYETYMNTVLKGYRWLVLAVGYFLMMHLLQDNIQIVINGGILNLTGFVTSITGVLMLIYCCKMLNNSKYITWIGRHTLGLYFLSGGIPSLLSVVLTKFSVETVGGVSYLFLSVLSFIVGVIVVYLIDRFTPFIFDLRLLKEKI